MMPFYAQVLAVLAIPVVLIHVVGLLGPPLYDLIRRDDDEVGPWWGAPVALTVFDTLVGTWFFVQTALTPGEEHAMGTRMGIATGLLALAGVLVGMVMALSFVRGITPGGETTRRFRTSVAAGLGMLGITVLLPLGLAKWNALGPLVWLLPAAWGGLAWVIGLNRRGPARIENARRVAVGWLVLAGNAALLSLVAMLIFAYWDDTANGVHHIRHVTGRSQRALALVLCAWGALMAGFRMVSGPWPRWIWPATAALVPPLFAGHLVWALFSPVPRFLELPAPLDVSGRRVRVPGNAVVTRRHCLRTPDGTEYDCQSWDDRMLGYPPDTSVADLESVLRAQRRVWIVLDDGTIVPLDWFDSAVRFRTRIGPAGPGRLTVTHPGGDLVEIERGALAEIAHTAVDPVLVADPTWTLQEIVTICLSVGYRDQCRIQVR